MIAASIFLSSCDNDTGEAPMTSGFTVTIENVFTGKSHFQGDALGAVPPGMDMSINFQAGKGHYLSFTTMLAQTNDLFFAPDDMGIPLYDMDGNALTGDVTNMIELWDAGTEVNEEPGVGPNQAPRQNDPNSGMDENGNIQNIDDVNDGFSYPDVDEMIMVELSHDGETTFTLKIYNLSNATALESPFAPGAWSVHGSGVSLFTIDMPASEAIERMAEDGQNTMLTDDITNDAGYVSPFAPGVFAVFDGSNPIFMNGAMASDALEALAEDGNTSLFDLGSVDGVSSSGVFSMPVGAGAPAPIFPGDSYSFSIDAEEGDMLSFASMLIQTNDLFVAPMTVNLFNNGAAVSGDITSQISLWDAYTEENEFPGAGNYQAPRQPGPDMGMNESGDVSQVGDSFTYPAISEMIRVTITNN